MSRLRTYNPLRRGTSELRKKPRPEEKKKSWRAGIVKETSLGMARLRSAAFHRSQGFCECGRPECEALPDRLRRVSWVSGQLHHVKKNGSRSDEIDWVLFVKRECHEILTGKLQWTPRRPAA